MFSQEYSSGSEGKKADIFKTESKNFIYLQGGYLLIGYNGTVNYERQLFRFGKNKVAAITFRGGYGNWMFWTGGGPGGILSAQLVLFKRSSHVEAGFGAGALYDRKSYNNRIEQYKHYNGEPPGPGSECMIYTPVINLGYRYQDPEKKLLYRVGMCYPEGAYMGLGIAF